MRRVYEPMLWQSYGTEDRIAFLIETGCGRAMAEEYAFREFASLPYKIREAIEGLEHFDATE